MYTITVWRNNDLGREVWLIKIPKKAREEFFEFVVRTCLADVTLKDYYRKWGIYGGYYINSDDDKQALIDLQELFGYKLYFVDKKKHKRLAKTKGVV